MKKAPVFHDTTLRDGNQSLAKPWNLEEKLEVFGLLCGLGVEKIEAGFPSASAMDFETCRTIAEVADGNITVGALTRAVEKDIKTTYESIAHAATPRIHIVLALSPFTMEHVLKMHPQKVKQLAAESVAYARSLIKNRGEVQFTAEHFGDCMDNLDFVTDTFLACTDAGADIINMPNTVERYRPYLFTNMVEKVVAALPKHILASVHCHNDLGMATATSVESYFSGAVQIETCLNGIGERAGNANLFEIAAVLNNCGVDTGLNMKLFAQTAKRIAELSETPIHQKAPLFGEEVVMHRSGIHQDGAAKTKHMTKGAYRPMDFSAIGRTENDRMGFTSQSGRSALAEILANEGITLSGQQASALIRICKKASETEGELSTGRILELFAKVQ